MFLAATLILASALRIGPTGAPLVPEPAASFIESSILSDNADVQLGLLAKPNASDRAMRDFGRTLARNHLKSREETTNVALAIGLTAPPQDELKPEAQREYDRLRRLTGVDFDRGFLRYVIRDHRRRIKALQARASEGGDQISAVAANQLPVLRTELDAAESVRRLERVLRRDRRNL